MKYCGYCMEENDEDALYCKKCGKPLNSEYKEENNLKTRQKNKIKRKTKVKNHNKTKKQVYDKREKGRMNFFQKFCMFFLIVLSITLATALGYIGYKIYQNQNIEVPEVTGLDYQNAANKLKEAKLNYVKEEKLTTDKDEEGIVLKQSKKAGSKTSEKTLIKLTVGVYDDTVVMPKVTSLKVDQALEKLNKLGIKYQIIYKETSDNFGIVLKQSINSDKKISKNTVVTLTITKQKAEENKDNQNQESNLEEKNENEKVS